MSAGVVRAADAVIAHSALVRGAVLRESPKTRVVEIPHHVVEAPRSPRDEARRALGLPLDRPVAASLGVVTPAKRIGKILEALASLPAGRRPFLFVGGAVGTDDPLHRYVDEHDLAGDVGFGGYLSDEDFWRAASAADFAVNLRHPTMGETSGAVCRLGGFGLPLVVSDTGWFRELPDAFAAKVPVGGDEVLRLAMEMEELAFDPERTRARSAAAAAWGVERRPDRVADAYADVLLEAAAGPCATARTLGFRRARARRRSASAARARSARRAATPTRRSSRRSRRGGAAPSGDDGRKKIFLEGEESDGEGAVTARGRGRRRPVRRRARPDAPSPARFPF